MVLKLDISCKLRRFLFRCICLKVARISISNQTWKCWRCLMDCCSKARKKFSFKINLNVLARNRRLTILNQYLGVVSAASNAVLDPASITSVFIQRSIFICFLFIHFKNSFLEQMAYIELSMYSHDLLFAHSYKWHHRFSRHYNVSLCILS